MNRLGYTIVSSVCSGGIMAGWLNNGSLVGIVVLIICLLFLLFTSWQFDKGDEEFNREQHARLLELKRSMERFKNARDSGNALDN